jgi:hypothetical protein
MIRIVLGVMAASLMAMVPAVAKPPSGQSEREIQRAKVTRALAAGPASITKDAKVIDRDEHGRETVLREGSGQFTCFPGHPGMIGDVPFCANRAAQQWEKDLADRKPQPTNSEPGIEYMLLGGSDWSGSDPTASSGQPIKEPPHWMILWPFDPKTTGLPITPQQTGSWIMYAGTPFAHLMINQRR